MGDTLGTIRELILQDENASNVEKLHIAAMTEIAEHLSWLALMVKISLVMMLLSIIGAVLTQILGS